jgi:hypothetical protein
MYIHGAPKRFNLFTENKPLGRLCKMYNPFFYAFPKFLSANVTLHYKEFIAKIFTPFYSPHNRYSFYIFFFFLFIMFFFFKFIIFLHSFIEYNHTPFILHHSPRPVFLIPHRVFAQQWEPPWDAETRFELGPALQQADALPTGLRRIYFQTQK